MSFLAASTLYQNVFSQPCLIASTISLRGGGDGLARYGLTL